jgi:hypothetical protein
MGNQVTPTSLSAGAPRTAGAPQGKPGESLREHQPQTTGTEQRPPEPSWEAALSDPLIFATLWLAVATTFLGIFTYRLWSATTTLANDTRTSGEAQAEKMERAIVAAGRSANSAEDALVISEDTAKRQLRAYVGIEKAEIFPRKTTDSDDRNRHVQIILKNFGQTPARINDVRLKAIFISDYPDSIDPDSAGIVISEQVINPGQLIPASALLTVPHEKHFAMLDDEVAMIVFGRFSFTDEFEKTSIFDFQYVTSGTDYDANLLRVNILRERESQRDEGAEHGLTPTPPPQS